MEGHHHTHKRFFKESEKYAFQYSAFLVWVIKVCCGNVSNEHSNNSSIQEGDYKMMSYTCILIIYTRQEE